MAEKAPPAVHIKSRGIIAAKDAQIAALTAKIEELTHKKSNSNSSTPPSTEHLEKPKELCRNYLYRMRRMNSSVQGVCAAIQRRGGRRAGAR